MRRGFNGVGLGLNLGLILCLLNVYSVKEGGVRVEKRRRIAPTVLCVLSLTVSLLLPGCATWRWSYSPEPPTSRAPLLSNTVTVIPLADDRSSEMFDNAWLWLVPLVLWNSAHADKVEESLPEKDKQFNPIEDIPKAVASELQNKGLFKAVVFSAQDQDSELVLKGRLASTTYDETRFSYGLSLYCYLLYIVGLPIATTMNELTFTLQIEEPQSRSLLWESSPYKAETRGLRGAYYGSRSGLWYDEMLKGLMPKILADLEQGIKKLVNPGQLSVPK